MGNAGAVINIVLGTACIVGGATGRLALSGTNSGVALAVAGAAAVGLGLFQIWRRRGH